MAIRAPDGANKLKMDKNGNIIDQKELKMYEKGKKIKVDKSSLPPAVAVVIEVASVIELSEASGRVAAGLFMTEG